MSLKLSTFRDLQDRFKRKKFVNFLHQKGDDVQKTHSGLRNEKVWAYFSCASNIRSCCIIRRSLKVLSIFLAEKVVLLF